MRVLFLVVDSVRADALGCYGSANATPTIDGLAASGARFETAVSSAPWTLPSLAAMLTGVAAHRLGLMKWEQPWPRAVPTLFDAFRAKGIETASFVFDPEHLFRACPEAGVVGSSQDTEAMLGWFRARPRGDYFAFVHYWWTHVPYVRKKLPLATWHAVNEQILALLSAEDPDERRANREQVKGLYALAVTEMSEVWLPALLDAARADVVVLVADHGESWGERIAMEGRLDTVFDLHGNHLHDEVLRVPWILHAPSLLRPITVTGLARTVDLAPTLIELCELDPKGGGGGEAGRSLTAALASGRIAHDAPAFSARNRDFLDAPALPTDPGDAYVEIACRDLATKVIAGFRGESARQYDLSADPGELCPAPVSGGSGRALAHALESERRAAVVAPLDPDDRSLMMERLRDLGYL